MERFFSKLRKLLISFTFLSVFVCVVVVGGVFGGYYYLNNKVLSKVDQVLASFSQETGIEIRYDRIDYDIFDGPEINGVILQLGPSKDALILAKIPQIKFESSFHTSPSIKVVIDQTYLINPSINLNFDAFMALKQPNSKNGMFASAEMTKKLTKFLTENNQGTIHVTLPVFIQWQGGTVHVQNKDDSVSLYDVQGEFKFEPSNATIILSSAGRLKNDAEKIAVDIEKNADGLNLSIKVEKFKLKPYAAHFPTVIEMTDETQTSGIWNFQFSPDYQIKAVSFDSSFDGFGLNHWRITEKPVQNIHLRTIGTIVPDFEKKEILFKNLQMGADKTFFKVNGMVSYDDKLKITTKLTLNKSKIQDVLNIFPKDFIPIIHDAKVSGTVAVDMDFSLDMAKPHKLVFDPKIDIQGFKLVQSPKLADIPALKKEFKHVARKKGKVIKEFKVGRSNRRFVSYHNLGKNVIRGVLTCEDGRFFRHNGFQLKHFRESIIQNLKEKRFVRGASTITMQLAKNLFLNGKKNISRKFQEVLLAYTLEQVLDKKRMFEIYMNIIEWGPKIYGIGSASRHYFYKSPSKLKPIEAAFLGSIIANPVKYHYMYSRGSVTGRWSQYLSVIVNKMHVEVMPGEEGEDPYQVEFGWMRKKKEKQDKKVSKTL